jgi:hypothetical protein
MLTLPPRTTLDRAIALVVAVSFLAASTGCANTVHRLDGEFPTAAGHPNTACERNEWLVVAPTRAELYDRTAKQPITRDDGVGLYRVGSSDPESLPELVPYMGTDGSRFARNADLVESHDRKQLLAGGLGVLGVIAITVGTVLFVGSFETRRTTNGAGQPEEEQHIDSTEALLGGVSAGIGFGLGAAGIIVTPSHADRAEANAGRYVFLPPIDPQDKVVDAVGRHNQRVRVRCVRNP